MFSKVTHDRSFLPLCFYSQFSLELLYLLPLFSHLSLLFSGPVRSGFFPSGNKTSFKISVTSNLDFVQFPFLTTFSSSAFVTHFLLVFFLSVCLLCMSLLLSTHSRFCPETIQCRTLALETIILYHLYGNDLQMYILVSDHLLPLLSL